MEGGEMEVSGDHSSATIDREEEEGDLDNDKSPARKSKAGEHNQGTQDKGNGKKDQNEGEQEDDKDGNNEDFSDGEEEDEEEEDEEEEEEDEDDDLESSMMTSNLTSESSDSFEGDYWVQWFCGLKGNEFFCEVDLDYIDDGFNLHGLSDEVDYFTEALEVIMDEDEDLDEEFPPDSYERQEIESSAEVLYGLIHARFILTARGLDLMRIKYQAREFGECLRIQCERQPLLPIGLSDVAHEATVKMFCPDCRNIYLPAKERHRQLDGCFWGRSFPHLFLMMNPDLLPKHVRFEEIHPTIYGFKIHKSSLYWSNTSKYNELTSDEDAGDGNLAEGATRRRLTRQDNAKTQGTTDAVTGKDRRKESDNDQVDEADLHDDQPIVEIEAARAISPPLFPSAADVNAQKAKLESLSGESGYPAEAVQAQEAKLEDLQNTLRNAVDSGIISPSSSIIEAVEGVSLSSSNYPAADTASSPPQPPS